MRQVGESILLPVARGTVIAAVVISPWLFGSAEPWAYLLMCLLAGVGLAAWLLTVVSNPKPGLRASMVTLALLALLAFGCVQMLPLPHSVARFISPLSVEAQARRVESYEKMAAEEFLPPELRNESGAVSISAAPAATRRSLYLLVAYIGVFLVMANTFTEWSHIRRAATAIVVSVFLMVVIGVMHKSTGSRDIFWFHTPRFGGSIFGPFTNRNHFAGHVNMAFGLTLGLLLVASRASDARKFSNWRDRAAWFSTRRGSRIALLGFAAALMGAAVCITLSRGGIAGLAASVGVVGVVAALRGAARSRGRVIVGVGLLIITAVIWLGWEPVVARLGTLSEVMSEDVTNNTRIVAARDTLVMFSKQPVAGCGFGGFQHVFPRFESNAPERMREWKRWTHTHNDYVQLIAEAGVTGTLLACLASVFLVRDIRRNFSIASHKGRLMVGGAAVGLLAIALHSLVDFGLHKPGNGFLFAALCGIAVAAVHLRPDVRKVAKIQGMGHES